MSAFVFACALSAFQGCSSHNCGAVWLVLPPGAASRAPKEKKEDPTQPVLLGKTGVSAFSLLSLPYALRVYWWRPRSLPSKDNMAPEIQTSRRLIIKQSWRAAWRAPEPAGRTQGMRPGGTSGPGCRQASGLPRAEWIFRLRSPDLSGLTAAVFPTYM